MKSIKKENLNSIVLIIVMITIALGATYAYMNLTVANNNTTGQGGCFNVSYLGTTINNSSLKSTTNYEEGANSQITLSKSEDCLIYSEATIYMHTDNDTTTAPISTIKALKYKILQGSSVIAEGVIDDLESDKALATISLNTTATIYDVYIWVDSAVSVGQYNEKTYNGYLYAKSSQTSTINE